MVEILEQFDLVPLDAVMIVVGAFVFVAFWSVFGSRVAKPFADLVAAREKATIGADESANQVRLKASEIEQQFENVVTEQRVKSLRERFEAVAKAKSAAAQVVSDAETEAQSIVKAARVEAQGKLRTLREQALGQADDLARALAQRAKDSVSMQ
jgi:F0F1-type ATP synthase membrane subunit b/b'